MIYVETNNNTICSKNSKLGEELEGYWSFGSLLAHGCFAGA
jgi:hypothetical protein